MNRLWPLIIAVVLSSSGYAENLVPNSAFTIGASRGWVVWGSESGDAFGNVASASSRVITDSHPHGDKALRFISRAWHRPILLTNGTYTLTFSALATNRTVASPGVMTYDLMKASVIDGTPARSVNVSNTWQRYTNTFTVGTNGWYSTKFYSSTYMAFQITAIQLERGSTASAYGHSSVIEVGMDMASDGNLLFSGDTRVLPFKFWNSGPATNVTVVYNGYDINQSNVISGTISTNALSATTNTTINLALPAINGWIRFTCYITNMNNTWDETSLVSLPFAAQSGIKTNGILGVDGSGSDYHQGLFRKVGITSDRIFSAINVARWHVDPLNSVQPSALVTNAAPGAPQYIDAYLTLITNKSVIPFIELCSNGEFFNSWATTSGNTNILAYSNYCRIMVLTYSNQCHNWEIWNEPQLAATHPALANIIDTSIATNYVKLFEAGARAVKTADPNATVIGMGGIGDGNYAWDIWTRLSAQGKADMDVVSCHLYPQDTAIDPNITSDDSGFTINAAIWWQYFGTNRPIWNTETATYSATGFKGENVFYEYPFFFWQGGTSPSDNNQFNIRMMHGTERIVQNFVRHIGLGFKNWVFQDGRFWSDTHNMIGAQGLAHPTMYEINCSIKPEAAGLFIARNFMRNPGLGPIVSPFDGNIEMHQFTNELGCVVAFWSKDKLNKQLVLSNSTIGIFDINGNLIQTNNATTWCSRSVRYAVSGFLSPAHMSNTFKYMTVTAQPDFFPPKLTIDASPIGQIAFIPTVTNVFKWTAVDDTTVPWTSASTKTNILYRWSFDFGSTWTPWNETNHLLVTFATSPRRELWVQAKDKANNISAIVKGPSFGDLTVLTNVSPPLSLPLGKYDLTRGYPTQYVTIDYQNPSASWENGADLMEVKNGVTNAIAYQVVSNRTALAFRGALGKLSTNDYYIKTGVVPTATNAYATGMRTNGGLLEITNGLTGVRVPWNTALTNMAPIQGIQLATGVWVATNNIYLKGPNDDGVYYSSNAMTRSTNFSFRIVESGPIRIAVELVNLIAHPGFANGAGTSQTPHTGYITNYVWLDAGEPNIMIRVATDWTHKWRLNTHPQFTWSASHWVGHITLDSRIGTNYQGTTYDYRWGQAGRGWYWTNDMFEAATATFPTANAVVASWPQFNPDQPNHETYYEPTGTNSLGVFTCCASVAMGAHASGWSVWGQTNGANRAGGLAVVANYDLSDNRTATQMVFTVGIRPGFRTNEVIPLQWTGLSSDMDTNTPPIQIAINNLQFGLDKFAHGTREITTPVGGWQGNYVTSNDFATLRAEIASSPSRSNYYAAVDGGSAVALVKAWGLLAELTGVLTSAQGSAETQLRNNITGYGGNAGDLTYYAALYPDQAKILYWNEVLRRSASGNELAIAQAGAALGTYRALNRDLIPFTRDTLGMFQSSNGVSWIGLGLPNQQVQGYALGYEQVLSFNTMRDFSNTVPTAAQFYADVMSNSLNSDGAPNEGVGYQLALLSLPMAGTMQLAQLGTNLWSIQPNLTNYAQFAMDIQTPPEPRWGNIRMHPADGDTPTKAVSINGQVANLARPFDTNMASMLMESWWTDGSNHNSFYATTEAQIMEAWPTNVAAVRRSRRYTDYGDEFRSFHSVLGRENYLWHWIGKWKSTAQYGGSGHAHADRGGVTAYGLGAPMITRFGNNYSPTTGSGTYENSVIHETDLPTWNGSFGPADSVVPWSGSTNGGYCGFNFGGFSESLQTNATGTWGRQITHAAGDPLFPVFAFRDGIGGDTAVSNQLAMWNLDTTNVFGSDNGAMFPRTTNGMNGISSGTSNWTAATVHTFKFTNSTWAAHPSSGINLNVYVYSPNAVDWTIGKTTHSQGSDDNAFFLAANGVSFWEIFANLRMRFVGECYYLFVPYQKGKAPPSVSATHSGGLWTLTTTTNRYEISTNYYAFTNNLAIARLVASVNPYGTTNHGVTITGGQLEARIVSTNALTVAVSGGIAGTRNVLLPKLGINWPTNISVNVPANAQLRVSTYGL